MTQKYDDKHIILDPAFHGLSYKYLDETFVSSDVTYRLYEIEGLGVSFWYPRSLNAANYENDQIGNQALSHSEADDLASWVEFIKTRDARVFFSEGKKILDVGCGNGAFLCWAVELGMEATGIDFDQQSIMVAQKRVGSASSVYRMSLEDMCAKERYRGYFDIITIFEVIEHQVNLKAFLGQLSFLLKPGGIVIGSTPNKDRLMARLGFREPFDFPPNHFYWFNASGLKTLLSNEGFEVLKITNAIRRVSLKHIRYCFITAIWGTDYLKKAAQIKSTLGNVTANKKRLKIFRSILLSLVTISMAVLWPIASIANFFTKSTMHIGFIVRKK